jgi:2-methylcitrate dehydratase PrpD
VLGAKPEEIERIDVATFRFASVMRNPDPPNYFASKYSLPHVAACLAARGSAGYAAVDDSALDDPAIAALRHRVHIREDPALTATVPASKPARVTLTLKDGRQATRACDSPRGDCLNPYRESEIREKFRELAGAALTAPGLDAVEHAIDRLEHLASATDLIDLLQRHARPDWGRAG